MDNISVELFNLLGKEDKAAIREKIKDKLLKAVDGITITAADKKQLSTMIVDILISDLEWDGLMLSNKVRDSINKKLATKVADIFA